MYTILNVDDNYDYVHEYKSIEEAKDKIREYEDEDMEERDMLQHYQILDKDYEVVHDNFHIADVKIGLYIKAKYF